MLRNYLKVAWRHLTRQKGYAAINVLGLAVGLAAALLIALFVQHEWSYDRFHDGAEHTYRVLLESTSSGDVNTTLPEMVGPSMQEALPEVQRFVRTTGPMTHLITAAEQRFYQENVLAAGPAFFEVFTLEPAAGTLTGALAEPGTAVLTTGAAEGFFGTRDAVGKTFAVGTPDEDGQQPTYTVTAVIEPVPTNSHFDFEVVLHRESHEDPRWTMRTATTYVQLHAEADTDALRERLPDYTQDLAARHAGPGQRVDHYRLRLQPLTSIHLDPMPGAEERTGPRQYLLLFTGAALLILLIACINYMNLATARALRRAREVGMRKTLGATRGQLARQFLAEALLVTAVALVLALSLVRLSLPAFGAVVGVELDFRWADERMLLLLVLGAGLAAGLLSGSYPAFVLSRFQPVRVLKGSAGATGLGGGFRKGLVVFQFAASIALILGALTIHQQMEYARSAQLDAAGAQVVTFSARPLAGSHDAFRQELLRRPSVQNVAFGTLPGDLPSRATYSGEDGGPDVEVLTLDVGRGYLEAMGLELIAGTGFEHSPAGTGLQPPPEGFDVILNESAVEWLGLEDPVGLESDRLPLAGRVVGVVRDFHHRSLHHAIGPVVLRFFPNAARHGLVTLREGQVEAGLADVRAAWGALVPERPLQYAFLDEHIDAAYRAERRLGRLFAAFAGLAVLVAALGLFGLTAYTAERRTKEIGIRKVLGASAASIVVLLSKDFLKLVAVAFILAVLPAYLALQHWLQDFAYRITVGPGLLLGTGLAALLVALLTVSYQALNAAWTNPADAIRSE